MPLSEFTRYGNGAPRKRWAKMLYNRAVSSGLDYFINTIKGNTNSIIDKNEGGFLKQKGLLGEEGNEKAPLKCNDSEPISYEWMFIIPKANTRTERGYQLFESWVS